MEPDFILQKKKGHTLAVNPRNSRWVLLGGIATDIVELMSRGHSKDAIVSALHQKYETELDTLKRDVDWVEAKLYSRGLLGAPSAVYGSQYLSNLLLEVTRSCNLKCAYCYVEHTFEEPLLTAEEEKSVIDQFVDLGGRSLALSGGEPLLCDFLFDLVEYASQRNVQEIHIITNGTLWTDREVSRVADLHVGVTVSLDSLKKEIHEFLRGKGHGRVIKTIEMLLDYGMGKNIKISTTPTNYNLLEIPAIINYCLDHGVGTFECPCFVRRGRGKREGRSLAPNTAQVNKLIHTLWKYDRETKNRLRIESYYISSLKILATNKGGAKRCPIGESFRISPTGYLYPCVFGDDFNLGSIRKQSLTQILDNSHSLAELKAFSIDTVEECRGCVWKYVCAGGCRAVAYEKCGTIASKSAFCSPQKDTFWEIVWSLIN